jgi:hypothetical protein
MKLFAIYIGGKTDTSIIELHDMRFIIAEKIEETYPELIKQWWGSLKHLHLDCWGALTSADGHNIYLKTEPPTESKKLFFVNMGGYDSKKFTELHENLFIVAEDKSEAKTKALTKIKQETDWELPHRDYLYDVEHCFCINSITDNHGYFIHLEQTDNPVPFEFTCKYLPIESESKS